MPCINKLNTLKPLKLKREKHPLPELGEDAYCWVRALSSKELVGLRKKYGDEANTGANLEFTFDVLALCVVDDDGARVFDSAEAVKDGLDVALESVIALADRCVRVSGLAKDREGN